MIMLSWESYYEKRILSRLARYGERNDSLNKLISRRKHSISENSLAAVVWIDFINFLECLWFKSICWMFYLKQHTWESTGLCEPIPNASFNGGHPPYFFGR